MAQSDLLPKVDQYPDLAEWAKALIVALGNSSTAESQGQTQFQPGDVRWTLDADYDPDSWLLADGSVYPVSDYTDLAQKLGTFYNTGGEGPDEFRVPDFRGVHLIGASARSLPTGTMDLALAQAQLPDIAFEVNDLGHVHGIILEEHTHGLSQTPHFHEIIAEINIDTGNSIGSGAAAEGGTGTPYILNEVFLSEGATANINIEPAEITGASGLATTGIEVRSGGAGTPIDLRGRWAGVLILIKT